MPKKLQFYAKPVGLNFGQKVILHYSAVIRKPPFLIKIGYRLMRKIASFYVTKMLENPQNSRKNMIILLAKSEFILTASILAPIRISIRLWNYLDLQNANILREFAKCHAFLNTLTLK